MLNNYLHCNNYGNVHNYSNFQLAVVECNMDLREQIFQSEYCGNYLQNPDVLYK